MTSYNPIAWYWKDDAGEIYSSAERRKIDASDPAFVAWLDGGNLPTPWPRDASGQQTGAALDEVLTPYGISSGLVAPTLDSLKAAAVVAASGACSAITAQIVPDVTHQNAYLNAAALVGPGATVPTADPAKTVFAGLATAFGMQPSVFASLVVNVQLASMQLSTILSTVEGAAQAAKSVGDLSAALTAFESSISAFVASLNTAGLTIQVKAPAAISIVGLYA